MGPSKTLLFHLFDTMVTQAQISVMNKEKMTDAATKYHDAVEYPRKKKKAVRRVALKEYRFWYSIDSHYDQLVGI